MKSKILILFLSVFVVSCVTPKNFKDYRVVKVHDGDTVTVMIDTNKVVLRLAYIDAPELKQPYGIESRNFLSNLLMGVSVELVQGKKDKYGRMLAQINLGSTNVNFYMVQRGQAWVYYNNHDMEYIKAQHLAINNGLGLWQDPKTNIVAPWEWRKRK